MAHNWKGVGEALRLSPDLLNTIEANHPTNVKECLSAVLTGWLKKNYNTSCFGSPSWKLLVAAVADPAGGNDHALAERIAQKYSGNAATLIITFEFLYVNICTTHVFQGV